MAALPQGRIRLRRELQHVAPIGEHRGPIRQHRGHPGAAGEPSQPSQTFGGGWNILPQMFIRARDDEAVQALADEFEAKCRQLGLGHDGFLFLN